MATQATATAIQVITAAAIIADITAADTTIMALLAGPMALVQVDRMALVQADRMVLVRAITVPASVGTVPAARAGSHMATAPAQVVAPMAGALVSAAAMAGRINPASLCTAGFYK